MSYSYGTIDANYPKPALPYFARSNRPTTTQGYRQTSASRSTIQKPHGNGKISQRQINSGKFHLHQFWTVSEGSMGQLWLQNRSQNPHNAKKRTLHTCCTRWRTYSRSSRSTRSRRSRNFKESFRAILEGFRNALQSKQVHNSRNFKGVKKFTAANPDREDSAKQNSLTARSRNSFLWVEGVEVALPKGISRGSTRVLSASLRLA